MSVQTKIWYIIRQSSEEE